MTERERISELEKALRFYADPRGAKDEFGERIPIPDFYDELEFGEYARRVLVLSIPAPQSGMGDEVERRLLGELQALAFELRKRDGNMLHPHYESELVSRAAARIKALSILPRAVLTPEQAGRDVRQATVVSWASAAFGVEQTTNIEQRGLRLAEETIEACQAAGCDAAMLHKLIDYVYSRPVGAVAQELGGVGLCTLAMANAAGLSADAIEQAEVARVLAKPIQMFSARNKDKNDAGFLASALNRATDGDGK